MRFKFLCLCSLLCASPLYAQGNPRDFEKPGPAAERQMYYAQVRRDLNEMLGHWRNAWQRDDARTLANFYADDASYHPPGLSAVQSRRSISDYFGGFLQTVGAVQLQMLDFGTSGDLAYITAGITYHIDSGSGAGKQQARTDLLVLRRSFKGQWQIQTHLARDEPDVKSSH